MPPKRKHKDNTISSPEGLYLGTNLTFPPLTTTTFETIGKCFFGAFGIVDFCSK